MRRKKAGREWRNLNEAVDVTVNALLELGLPRNQGGAARDMILLVVRWFERKEGYWWF